MLLGLQTEKKGAAFLPALLFCRDNVNDNKSNNGYSRGLICCDRHRHCYNKRQVAVNNG